MAPLPQGFARELLTREQAAEYARVSVATIDRARKRGELRYTTTNRANGSGRIWIHPSWIDEWYAGEHHHGLGRDGARPDDDDREG